MHLKSTIVALAFALALAMYITMGMSRASL